MDICISLMYKCLKLNIILMKHLFLFFLINIFFISCGPDKEDPVVIQPGTYKGQFYHTSQNTNIDPSNVTLTFTDQKFSGSSDKTYFPAICNGSYKVTDQEIEFINGCSWPANFDWNYILNGKFKIKVTGNSLELTKQSGNNTYYYKLQKQ